MEFLTNEKLTIVGAAGMIGSNMAQTAIMMHLTPNICLYDPYESKAGCGRPDRTRGIPQNQGGVRRGQRYGGSRGCR